MSEKVGENILEIKDEETINFNDERIFEKEKSISRKDIVKLSDLSAIKLEISEKEVPNPEYSQEIFEIRELIETILSDEELLIKFIELDNSIEFHTDHLPELVKDIISKSGAKDTDDLANTFKSILNYSDYRSIDLYVENFKDENLYKALCKYADSYFQTKHILNSVYRAKDVIRNYFPNFYREFPFLVSVRHIENISKNSAEHATFKDKKHLLSLSTSESLNNKRNFDDMDTTGPYEEEYNYKRKNKDLVSMIHEYAHGLYAEIIGRKNDDTQGDYYKTADSAINEGFAVFIELKCCKRMIEDAQKIGLEKKDIQDLQVNIDQRMRWLEKAELSKNNSIVYAEGMDIMNRLYEDGGIENIEKFIRSVDVKKTTRILRESNEYKEAINDEKKYKSLFLKE